MSAIGIAQKKGKWVHVSAEGKILEVGDGFFDAHPVYSGIVEGSIVGQHMVRIPYFYYAKTLLLSGDCAGSYALFISDKPRAGFALHPAFMREGNALEHFLVGKYQATPDGDMLGSQPGKMPAVNMPFAKMLEKAMARGDGWMMWSAQQLGAIKMLCMIEMCGMDSKNLIGFGNDFGHLGVIKVDDLLMETASWRGIWGLWGNVWQCVDGLRTTKRGRYKVWDVTGNKEYQKTMSNSFLGIGFDGFGTLNGTFPLQMPDKETHKSQIAALNMSTNNMGGRGAIAMHGGYHKSKDQANLFSLCMAHDETYYADYIGCRIAKEG